VRRVIHGQSGNDDWWPSQASLPVLRRVLDLSWRVSRHSPPMKPFIRRSGQPEVPGRPGTATTGQRLWDFDDTLQQVLMGIVHSVATPEQLTRACIERWDANLVALEAGRREQLRRLAEAGKQFKSSLSPRDRFILSRVEPGSRFLYVGCGSGTECIELASQGLEVTGIDTSCGLVEVANAWAKHLALPFKALCMDAMALELPDESFDGFLVEFYGEQVSGSQTLLLQKNLALALSHRGRGFFVAKRAKYASHWPRMGSPYSVLMTHWLARQSDADCRFSLPDRHEERLAYGVYWWSHTEESLAGELSSFFNVLESRYEESDPRYVMAVVARKTGPSPESPAVQEEAVPARRRLQPDLSRTAVEGVLGKVEAICGMLEFHEKNVSHFFERRVPSSGRNPFDEVRTDMSRFVELLLDLFSILPNAD
jgi:SAM-dependent methyltransferase